MNMSKISSMISLCQKAGKIISGDFACEKALSKKKALLVIVAKDASDNTRKKFEQKSFFYKVPFRTILTKKELGHAMGKDERAAVIITDENFVRKILELIDRSQ